MEIIPGVCIICVGMKTDKLKILAQPFSNINGLLAKINK